MRHELAYTKPFARHRENGMQDRTESRAEANYALSHLQPSDLIASSADHALPQLPTLATHSADAINVDDYPHGGSENSSPSPSPYIPAMQKP